MGGFTFYGSREVEKTTVSQYNTREYAGVAQLLERVLAKDEAQG
jgi:hypothetical protein